MLAGITSAPETPGGVSLFHQVAEPWFPNGKGAQPDCQRVGGFLLSQLPVGTTSGYSNLAPCGLPISEYPAAFRVSHGPKIKREAFVVKVAEVQLGVLAAKRSAFSPLFESRPMDRGYATHTSIVDIAGPRIRSDTLNYSTL